MPVRLARCTGEALQLKKDNEEREPRGEEVSAAEVERGDEYQRKRAARLRRGTVPRPCGHIIE